MLLSGQPGKLPLKPPTNRSSLLHQLDHSSEDCSGNWTPRRSVPFVSENILRRSGNEMPGDDLSRFPVPLLERTGNTLSGHSQGPSSGFGDEQKKSGHGFSTEKGESRSGKKDEMKEKQTYHVSQRAKKRQPHRKASPASLSGVAFSSDTVFKGSAPVPSPDVILMSLPDAVVVCNRDGKLCYLNEAARTLFEIPSTTSWWQIPYQQFLERYGVSGEPSLPLLSPPSARAETPSHACEHPLHLHLPSGRRVLLDQHSLSLLDSHQQRTGTISLFHELPLRYQTALHLQRVSEAITLFHQALVQIPEDAPSRFSPQRFLFSPPALVVSQSLTEVIHQVLECWRVHLVACGTPPARCFYVAGSGFSVEQEHQRRSLRGRFLLTDIADETILQTLLSNREVILRGDQLHWERLPLPAGFPTDAEDATFLAIPLFLHHRYAGILVIARRGRDSVYPQEEINLVKMVAAQAVLILDCLGQLQQSMEQQTRERVLQEVRHLSTEFLAFASHNLRTPLTTIKGNLQLAQRRLSTLSQHLTEPAHLVNGHLEHVQHSLAQAVQSTRRQENIIQEMIDTMRIQTHQFDLSFQCCDVLALVEAAVEEQQASLPQGAILLENVTGRSTLPITVDARRIQQVLTMYLTNALDVSPPEQPVVVQVASENHQVRVSVHDKGPGLSSEEQACLWEHFSQEKAGTLLRERDLRLGLRFHLCRVVVEQHRGQVGIESMPGHGATFWFRLPAGEMTSE